MHFCRFVETKILTDEDIESVKASGAEFANASDAADAVMRLLCDSSVHGTSPNVSLLRTSCIDISMQAELSPSCLAVGSRGAMWT